MELKTKYQYSYFIHPYVVEESKYSNYMYKLLKDKRNNTVNKKHDSDDVAHSQKCGKWSEYTAEASDEQ